LNLDVAREFSITRNRPTHDILIGDLFAFETQGVRAHTQRAPTQCRLPKLRTSVRELVSLACSFRLRWTFLAPKKILRFAYRRRFDRNQLKTPWVNL
jgi:hypothetical protein